jgi:predicted HNH restriction endonuclease
VKGEQRAMIPTLRLRAEQIRDFAAIRDLGPDLLNTIVDGLQKQDRTLIKPEQLSAVFDEILGEKRAASDPLLRQLLSVYALRRETKLSTQEVFQRIAQAIRLVPHEQGWTEEQVQSWEAVQRMLENLLDSEQLAIVAKSIDLSYEYQNLLRTVRIITDIRPVFNIQATEVKAAIVTFVMQLYFYSQEGEHSLTLAVDESDIAQLKLECERALNKGVSARNHMLSPRSVPTIISGEKTNES